MLTTDQWADYLIYLNPQQKVFVDGRSDFYGPEIGNQYIHLMDGHGTGSKCLSKYDFIERACCPSKAAACQLLEACARTGGWWRTTVSGFS